MKLGRIERWFVNSPMRQAMQALVVRWFRAIMPLAPGADIVEIGCGRGAGARLIVTHFSPRRLFLGDLDPRMVRLARQDLSGVLAVPTVFCVADVAALPVRSDSADAAFGFGFLHHVPDWRRGLAEVQRVLKPGGIYYLEEYYPSLYQNILTRRLAVHPEHDRFNSLDLRDAFQGVGLDLYRTFELRRFGILGVGLKRAPAREPI